MLDQKEHHAYATFKAAVIPEPFFVEMESKPGSKLPGQIYWRYSGILFQFVDVCERKNNLQADGTEKGPSLSQ